MRKILSLSLIGLVTILAGCGYSTNLLSASGIRTIYVEQIVNNVGYAEENERRLYIPLLEVNVRNALIDRFLLDGNLRVATPETADVILKGELLQYDRQVLKYDDSREVEESRISITMSLTLWDRKKEEAIWHEGTFTGEATYYATGPLAKSESMAIDAAMTDLARRVVERAIENW